jgi:hypothetical protein
VKERGRDYADFEWQGGDADFSVSQSNLEQVKQYNRRTGGASSRDRGHLRCRRKASSTISSS